MPAWRLRQKRRKGEEAPAPVPTISHIDPEGDSTLGAETQKVRHRLPSMLPLRNLEVCSTRFYELISRGIVLERVTKIRLTHARGKRTLSFASEYLRGARERNAALPEGKPTRARAAGDLGRRKAESPALFFCCWAVTLPLTVLGNGAPNLLPSPMRHVCARTARAHGLRGRQGRRGRHARIAAARFVGQSLYALSRNRCAHL